MLYREFYATARRLGVIRFRGISRGAVILMHRRVPADM
jgi:hypothetical protein